MTRYRVFVDDNFHYMDEEERYEYGVFPTAEEAIAACKRIVDEDLNERNKPGVTAEQLYDLYVHFCSDPFIVPVDPKDEQIKFSGWGYAKERCSFLASDEPSSSGAPTTRRLDE